VCVCLHQHSGNYYTPCPAGALSDLTSIWCLSDDVCCVHLVGGRHWWPAGNGMMRIVSSGLTRPACLKAATARFHCSRERGILWQPSAKLVKSTSMQSQCKILFTQPPVSVQLQWHNWVYYIAVFLCGVRWRHNRAPNLEPLFGQFRTSLRKDSVANYASIWMLFSTSFTGPDVLCNALNISYVHL